MKRKTARKILEPNQEQELRKYTFIGLAVFIVFCLLQLLMPYIKNLYFPKSKDIKTKAQVSPLPTRSPEETVGKSFIQEDAKADVPNIKAAESESNVKKTTTLSETVLNEIFISIKASKELSQLSNGSTKISIQPGIVTLKMESQGQGNVTVIMVLNEAKNALVAKNYTFENFSQDVPEQAKKLLADSFSKSLNEYMAQRVGATKVEEIILNSKSLDIVYF